MTGKYFISKNGKQSGPYEFNHLVEMIKLNQLIWSDYVFSENQHDWILLLEHSEFGAYFVPEDQTKASKASFKLNSFEEDDHLMRLKDKAWFVLKDGNNYGPFSKLDLVHMLQNKTLFEYDYAWQLGFSTWVRIAEIEEFMPDHIKNLQESGVSDISEVFFRRRHMRAKFGSTLIVHNNQSVFKGESLEISTGGAGIVISTSELQPNQTLFLHFKPGDGVPSFNAICQIISKQQYRKFSLAQDLVKYGVRFTKIKSEMRDAIDYFTKQKAVS